MATKTMSIEDSFYLTLNEFGKTVKTIWKTLQTENDFCDMTLACGDTLIQTHKVIISAMSPVLRNILKQNILEMWRAGWPDNLLFNLKLMPFLLKVKIIINLYEVFLVAVYGNYKRWPLW